MKRQEAKGNHAHLHSLANDIASGNELKYSQSLEVGLSVLKNEIVEKAAEQVWEKDILKRCLKPYINKWTIGQGIKMYHFRPEDRLDDEKVTPKAIQK